MHLEENNGEKLPRYGMPQDASGGQICPHKTQTRQPVVKDTNCGEWYFVHYIVD